MRHKLAEWMAARAAEDRPSRISALSRCSIVVGVSLFLGSATAVRAWSAPNQPEQASAVTVPVETPAGDPQRTSTEGVRPAPLLAQAPELPPSAPAAPAPGAPPAGQGAPPGGPPPGPPPVPVLLGIADFLIQIDRPFDAEGIYRGILAHDANNAGALAGLRHAKIAQKTTWTALWHQYTDSHDVVLRAYGGGPTFRTPYGNITLTAGTGHYRNDNNPDNPNNPLGPIASTVDDRRLRKSTLNLLLEPHYKKYEGRLFASRVTYDTAPNRTLWDLKFMYVPEPNREVYSVTYARRDSILQSAQSEFFGPESFYTVLSRLLIDEIGVGIQHPLGKHWDLTASYSTFDYSDGNGRDTAKASIHYRLKPKPPRQMPVFRVGVGYAYDNTDNFAPLYYSPQNIQSVSLLADYVTIQHGFQMGLFAGYPIARDRGTGFAKHDPAKTLFGFVKYDLNEHLQLYLNGGAIDSPGFDLSFTDFVIGVNGRF
jgi:hypothetical protein